MGRSPVLHYREQENERKAERPYSGEKWDRGGNGNIKGMFWGRKNCRNVRKSKTLGAVNSRLTIIASLQLTLKRGTQPARVRGDVVPGENIANPRKKQGRE